MKSDFEVSNHGSVFLLQPLNDAAREHLTQHVDQDAQWFAGSLAVEHRYIGDIVVALREEGFAVE